jgi:hypothetical protein
VDQLDPLSATGHNPDQLPEPSHYRCDENALKTTMLRLFGFDGRVLPKLNEPAKDQENTEEAEMFDEE